MVRITKQKIDGVNKRVKENIHEAKESLEAVRNGNTEKNIDTIIVVKLKLERNLQKLKEMLNEIDEQENEITTQEYQENQLNAEDMLSELEVIIMNCKERQKMKQNEKVKEIEIEQKEKEKQMEQKEKEKRMEMELREKEKRMELDAEIEKERLHTEEKIQLEKVNLERLKIETEAKTQTEKIEAEVKLKEIHSLNNTKELEVEIIKVQKEMEDMKSIKSKLEEQSTIPKTCTIRLPKLELKKFGGEILKWQEFWDMFEASIHNNPSLHAIDKFNYLRAQLENDALKAISGLQLTNLNYDAAINILKERYGNEQLIVDMHYTQLMEMPPAINKTTSLRETYDVIEQHLRSLQSMGEDVNQRQMISIIRTKLPKVVIAYLEQQKDADKNWTVDTLRKSLKVYITAQEVAENQFSMSQQDQGSSKAYDNKGRNPFFKKPFGTTDALLSSERYQQLAPKCIYCDKPHWSDECRTVSTLQERKEKAKSKCYICLRSGHIIANCKVERPCFHCKKTRSHHRSLCPSLFQSNPTTSNSVLTVTATNQESETYNKEASMLSAGEQVIMQTALVEVMDSEEIQSQVTRILMDTGSQRTYVTEDIVKKLNLRQEGTDKFMIYTFGANKPKEIITPIVTLVLKGKEGNTVSLKASVVPQISGNIQRTPIQLTNLFAIQKKYKLADTLPKHVESSTLGVLIGSDYYNEIMSSEKMKIQEGLYVIKSKFGWIISGRTKRNEESNQENTMFIMTHSSSNILPEIHHFTPVETSLQTPPNIDDFWKLETIGITPPEKTKEDEGVMEHFKNTATKKNGRYQVTWPWKNEDTTPPENYELSLGRLKSLYKRLGENPELFHKYDNIIKDQLDKGIIEKIDEDSEEGERKHYIPHHAVVTPEKDTTKVRIVYDASAKQLESQRMLTQRTCHFRRYLRLADEVSNEEDRDHRRHRESIPTSSTTTERKRCHKISMAQRCEETTNT